MRIAIVSGIYPPDIGGPATHSCGLADELRDRGHEVTVITLTDGAYERSDQLVRFPRRQRWPVRFVRIALWIVTHRARVDVIYATGLHAPAALAARIARRPIAVKVVGDEAWERSSRRGLTSASFDAFQVSSAEPVSVRAMKVVRAWAVRSADAVVTPSTSLRDVAKRWGADAIVIANGVRSSPGRQRRSRPDGKLQLVFVGRLVAHKHVAVLARAAQRVDGVVLHVIGDGPDLAALRSLESDRVRLLGAMHHDEVLEHLRDADALVLASDYEGLPHVVLESLASGTPIITCDVGGTLEVVEHGVSAIVVQRDEDAYVRAFERLAKDPALRDTLRCGARVAGESVSLSACADKVAALLAGLVSRPRVLFVGSGAAASAAKAAVLRRWLRPMLITSGSPSLRRTGGIWTLRLPRPFNLAAAAVLSLRCAGVVCQSPHDAAAMAIAPKRLRPPVTVEVHGDWQTAARSYGRPARRAAAPLADRVARIGLRRSESARAVSRYTRDLLARAGFTGPIDIYPPFLDLAPMRGRVEPVPVRPHVVYVGALERVKGVDVLLDAWPLVRAAVPEAHLTVAGAGAIHIPSGNGVVATGSVDAPAVRELLDTARCVVVPSRSEGLGRVVVEAMTRGRCIVGSRVGGIGELVSDGATGILIAPGDRAALAAALIRVLTEPHLAQRLGSAAATHARSFDFSSEFEQGIARLAGNLRP